MRYIPLTLSDRKQMLQDIGVESTQDLFSSIPSRCRFEGQPALPSKKNESQLISYFSELADQNQSKFKGWSSYLGAGAYQHFIPSVVDLLSSRGEFATAYTPYQPEISQGTLQAIFEFQSMIAALYGMEVSNASMYDGASSLAEAVLMAGRIRKQRNVYISQAVHPEYIDVVRSYTGDVDLELIMLPVGNDGRTQIENVDLEQAAAVVFAQPNFFGVIEDLTVCKKFGDVVTIVANTDPLAFGLLQEPGAFDVDIVVGEGQSLGNPLHFGGPHVGLLCSKKKYLRQLPGRLVGKSIDEDGREAYVLTLSTREQHIRRQKATSNICTNHSLIALRSAIYMACMGRNGVMALARKNYERAHTLCEKLLHIPGVKQKYASDFFHEFVLELPTPTSTFLANMEKQNILAGIDLSTWNAQSDREILICATEVKSDQDLDLYVNAFRGAL
ncbi:MAG: aminomethyl-transferring glycine dehydrogenase subunit GcvPA [Bdellovibrionota bacterium]